MRRVTGLVGILTLCAAVLVPATYGYAAKVSVDAGDGFDRIRFDWPSRVKYSAQRFGNTLLLEFARPVRGNIAEAAANLDQFVGSARRQESGREVVVEFTGGHRFRTFRDGNAVVVMVGSGPGLDLSLQPKSASKSVNKTGTESSVKAVGAAARASERLAVRVGAHPTYNRIVFDWRRPAAYEVKPEDGRTRISFSRPATIDVDRLRARLPSSFAGIASELSASGNLDVVIPVPEGIRVRHLVSGPKVVVDLVKDPDAKAPKVLKASKPQTVPQKVAGTQPSVAGVGNERKATSTFRNKDQVASQFGLASSQNPERATRPEPLKPGETITEAPPPVRTDLLAVNKPQKVTNASSTTGMSSAAIPPASISSQVISPATNGQGVRSDAQVRTPQVTAAPSGQTTVATQSVLEQGAPQGTGVTASGEGSNSVVSALKALEGATISGPSLPVAVTAGEQVTSLRFDWPEAVAAAVFMRAENLWVVFNQSVTFDLSQLLASQVRIMGRAEQIPVAPGSALRVPLVAGIAPRVWRDGNSWVVDLAPQSMRPDVALEVDTQQSSPQGPRVFVRAEGTGITTVARDPEVGDQLFVVPVIELSRGIDARRDYAQFRILSSVQGLVVRPLIDEIEVRVLPDGVAITASKLRGLEVSKPNGGGSETELVGYRTDGLPPGLTPGRIFNMVSWRRGAKPKDFRKTKLDLQLRIAGADIFSNGPRLSLAQFFFANGLAAEAMGMIRIIESSDEELGRRPDIRGMRGAAHFILGRYNEAEKDLDNPTLNGFAEAELWRGAANAAQGKWKDAIEHFARAGEIPGGYPRNFATQLAMLAAEAAVRAGDFRGAGGFLGAIAEGDPTAGEMARLNYLRGRVLYASGNIDRAREAWRLLAEGEDRWSRVRARRALIEHALREGTISRTEAIDQLERLRFAWRGDQLEFDLLRRLGKLYLEEDDFVKGLEALRQAVLFFPDNIFAGAVTKEMTEEFASIYTDGTADTMPPLTALSLYDQFRELTPVGRRGDAIIQRLADRLVQVDLLDRAAILLDRQVRFRLQGVPKAKVGSRLALIRLLDRQSQKALEALDESVAPGLDAQLSLQRKRLRARAIFELGDAQTALKLLRRDETREARLLRADIYWRTQDWKKAAEVFKELIGQAGQDGRRIDDSQATLILNWAVTLSMSDDFDQLNRARQIYGQQIDGTSYREAFRLITNRTEGELSDFLTLTARFEEIGRFQAFLSSYRDKLKDNPLSAVN